MRQFRKLLRARFEGLSRGRRRLVYFSGFGMFAIATFEHKFTECIDVVGNPAQVTHPHWLFWLRLIYGRMRSRWLGEVSDWALPVALRPTIFQLFAAVYGANLEEVRYPLDSFRTFNDFFSRTLVDGLRPVDEVSAGLVSPVDGRLLTTGVIDGPSARITQVKGATFSVPAFLGLDPATNSPASTPDGSSLQYAVLYLPTGNYHRFHAPCDVTFTQGRHFCGELLPVRESMLSWMDDVFAVNERVVLSGSWRFGQMHLTAVAASCVGGIFLNFDERLKTNRMRDIVVHCGGDVSNKFFNDVPIKIGDTVGGFKMGSTIVLVFDAPKDFAWNVNVGDSVRVGQRLGCVA